MIKCNHCGAKNENNAKECVVCGKRIEGKIKYDGVDNTPKPWYEKTWFVVLMLLIFFPVGLYLMWKYEKFNMYVRVAITVLIVIIIIVGYLSDGNSMSTNVAYKLQIKC